MTRVFEFTDGSVKKELYSEEVYDVAKHKDWIKLIASGEAFAERDLVLKELKRKFSSYKSQDKQKHKFNKDEHITFEQLVTMIDACALKCYYCNRDLCLFNPKKRAGHQWSLERLNNNLGHYTSNTCIACLQCNLQRRTDNYEYFKRGKSLTVQKIVLGQEN